MLAAQIAPRALIKRPRRVCDHRDGQNQTGPAQKGPNPLVHAVKIAGVQTDRQHHHLHGTQPGHRQPAQGHGAFALLQGFLAAGIERMGDIADGGDGGEDFAEPDLARVPAHAGAMGGIIDPKFQHPRQAADVTFVQPDAGGAHDALNDQRGVARVLAFDAHETLL